MGTDVTYITSSISKPCSVRTYVCKFHPLLYNSSGSRHISRFDLNKRNRRYTQTHQCYSLKTQTRAWNVNYSFTSNVCHKQNINIPTQHQTTPSRLKLKQIHNYAPNCVIPLRARFIWGKIKHICSSIFYHWESACNNLLYWGQGFVNPT